MNTNLLAALTGADNSTRLNAAMAAGIYPEPDLVETLVNRCAVEPDFHVRDMLTWALTQFPRGVTVPRLVAELASENPQARSQALHTLSKLKDARAWPSIRRALLRDPNDEVARSAWRAAVALVPDDERKVLAVELAAQLGRGDRDVQRSLSRALVSLGADSIAPLLAGAMASGDPRVRAHAGATLRLQTNPDAGFELDVNDAKRAFIDSKQR